MPHAAKASAVPWPPAPSLLLLLFIPLLALGVLANVDKAVFTGPAPARIPLAKPTLSDLGLDVLTPLRSTLRTDLARDFASATGGGGRDAWLLLDNLTDSQRYEVRLCWAASEPTSFRLELHSLDAVWSSPELMHSLAEYALSRQDDATSHREPYAHEREASVLLLRVRAAADYITLDAELMRSPPPVLVDIILDPLLLNLLPRSLLPTAGYLGLVGVVTWLLARRIASALVHSLAAPGDGQGDNNKGD